MDNEIREYLVVCGADGTLFQAGYGVPGPNIDAAERFAERGGKFTVCTGWNREAIGRIAEWVPFSAPAVLDNGTYVYDYAAGEVIMDDPMSFEAREVLADILEMFPTLCAVVTREPEVYAFGMNREAEDLCAQQHLRYKVCDLSLIPDGWHKAVLAGSVKDCMAARNYAYMQQGFKEAFAEFNYELSGPCALELLPKDCTRSTGLKALCEELGILRSNVLAIGSAPEDKDMLTAAGIKVSLSDGHPDIRSLTDFTVSSCLRGGVGEVLDKFDDIVCNYEQTEINL